MLQEVILTAPSHKDTPNTHIDIERDIHIHAPPYTCVIFFVLNERVYGQKILPYGWNPDKKSNFNPLTTSVPYHIETNQMIWKANQLTGSYMMGNIGR